MPHVQMPAAAVSGDAASAAAVAADYAEVGIETGRLVREIAGVDNADGHSQAKKTVAAAGTTARR